jgi:clathrin heavy chain
VNKVRANNALALVQKYLLHVQRENLKTVNEAVNELFTEEENYNGLRESIDNYPAFDQVALAQSLEHHELLEFRRISAYLYKINKRWDKSMELSKKDGLWRDTMETVAQSENRELAETLLTFFVENKQPECYAAMLFTCYELIRPDIVLELSWRNNLQNYAMPFMIQTLRDFDNKLIRITERLNEASQQKKDEQEEKKKVEEEQQQHTAAFVGGAGYNPMMAPLALGAPPGMQMGYGQGYGQPGMY